MKHVLVVGAGLSGLSACLEIEALGGSATLVEKTSAIGGRVATDTENGFYFDRGFQVLLSSYLEIHRLNLLPELKVKAYGSGAICMSEEGRFTLVHPFRHPLRFFSEMTKWPFTFYADGLKLISCLCSRASDSVKASEFLACKGFSKQMEKGFLYPFFGGVFLDTKLETRSSLLTHYLRLFSRGQATLPEQGMAALPEALWKRLHKTELLLSQEAIEIFEGSITLKSGQVLKGDAVIVAVESPSYPFKCSELSREGSQKVRCLYFALKSGLIKPNPFLYLGSSGPILNLSVLNHIQPSYAPSGYDLVSVSIVDPLWQSSNETLKVTLETLASWFGVSQKCFEFLREYKVVHALPSQRSAPPLQGKCKVPGYKRVYLAGELADEASINGALVSGRKAARAAIGPACA